MSPTTRRELAETLVALKGVAGHWADLLFDLQESTGNLAGPLASAALELAFRRAEQSYVELEIAHGDTAGRNG